jgi:hypothetical protein
MSRPAQPLGNIGRRGRTLRLALGLAGISGGVVAAVLLPEEAMRDWRALIVFGLFWLGLLGLFEAGERTCVALAACGLREGAAGARKVGGEERGPLRVQAYGILLETTVVAALLALVVKLVRAP